jgi:hypothetical protein
VRASTRAFISGQKTQPAAVLAGSNSRFRCYRNLLVERLNGREAELRGRIATLKEALKDA